MVESYLGAIFVDSEFNYSVVETFFDAHIRPYFLDMSLYDSFANAHPTTFFVSLMEQTFHCTHWRLMADELVPGEDADEGRLPTVVAVVMIHFQVVSDSEGTSTRYAKVRASQKAVAAIEKMDPAEFRRTFRCDCGQHKESEQGQGDEGEAAGSAI